MIPRISVYYYHVMLLFLISKILNALKSYHKLLEILPNREDLKSRTGFFGVVDPRSLLTATK